jgi:toxin FitB
VAAKRVFLVDTSVAVASIVEDHEAHAPALAALEGRHVGLAGHAWFETFSVLTRLPGPARRGPDTITRVLTQNFPETRWLPEADAARLASSLAPLGIAGGSVYDALVAMTAISHNLVLITRDQRAAATYAALGATVEAVRP